MIAGHKTDTYLTAERLHPQLNWIVTKHTVVNELHATKGWRTVRHDRKEQLRTRLPAHPEWQLNDTTTFKRALPKKEFATFQFANEAARERSLMRHSWYRRQKEKEARAAATEAWRDHGSFFAGLTEERKQAALAYRGEENHGDPAYQQAAQ